MSRHIRPTSGLATLAAALAALLPGCGENPAAPADEVAPRAAHLAGNGGPYVFAPPVFDIEASVDGGILVAQTVFPDATIPPAGEATSTVHAIRGGQVRELARITTVQGSPINGLAAVGPGEFFATSGGKDQAVGAGVWHVSRGQGRLVGDIEAFETENDPDAFEGLAWKNPACEEVPPFTAGPQSNPYHLTSLSRRALPDAASPNSLPRADRGSPLAPPASLDPPLPGVGTGHAPVLVGDAAGNTLLSVRANGRVDPVAVFTPATEDGSGSQDPADWMVLFAVPDLFTCYVQPVPTSVAIGPEGAYYVGELTGVTPADIGAGGGPSTGLSRVWRIRPGARNEVCPSADCEVAFSGFTSIIDLAFGPDGGLHVVEYDEAGWFAATGGGATGGTINRCDLDTGACAEVVTDLILPSAITFDRHGDLWLLENNIIAPTVRRLE